MTNLDWAKLGFKLVGFWFMVTAVSMAANVATLIGQPAVTGIALSMLYPVTRALIGILIWMYSDRLALSIFPTTATGQNVVGQSQQEQLFALAISIIGIGLLVDSIPTFLYDLTLFIASRSGEYRSALVLSRSHQVRVFGMPQPRLALSQHWSALLLDSVCFSRRRKSSNSSRVCEEMQRNEAEHSRGFRRRRPAHAVLRADRPRSR